MEATAHGPLVWARAAMLAAVSLLTGTLAHVSAHGLLPGPVTMAALLLVGTTAAAPFLRTQASTARVVVLLALGQTVVHGALTALAGHRGEPAEHGAHSLLGAVHHLTEDLTGPHAAMALAHALAAATVGAWLASGEHALWALVGWAGRALARLPEHAPPPAPALRAAPAGPWLPRPATSRLATSLTRRGPPSAPAC